MTSRTLIVTLIIVTLAIVSAGCTGTPAAQPQALSGNGTLHATTVPAGAEVYLDGEYRGLTPSAIGPVPAGRHTLEFKKSGYESVEHPVTVVAGGWTGSRSS